MFAISQKLLAPVVAAISVLALTVIVAAASERDGIVRVRSAYPLEETISRINKDVADKGIRFFSEIDQSKLAADTGVWSCGPQPSLYSATRRSEPSSSRRTRMPASIGP